LPTARLIHPASCGYSGARETVGCVRQDPAAALTKFHLDAEALVPLLHGNLAGVLGVCFHETQNPVLVSAWVSGGSLHQYAQSMQGRDVPQLLGMAEQVAGAMEYLAKRRVVHRSLTAANCMLTDTLQVKAS